MKLNLNENEDDNKKKDSKKRENDSFRKDVRIWIIIIRLVNYPHFIKNIFVNKLFHSEDAALRDYNVFIILK